VGRIDTGVAFFDHMLTLFAKHGLFDLTVKAKGDTDVDYHHTVEDVGLALGDALAQVVNNLLSNAVKYGVSGGKVSLQLLTGPGMAELQVLDRGPGIPEGCSERVFEEFFRADDALASGVTGAGLGLTLARRIARDHGGDVTFKPREGGGSLFRFTLPLPPSVEQPSV
jgi:signal transduction histidine kinase